MEFGLFTWFSPVEGGTHAESFVANFREIDAAEEMGWDSVWLPETHFGGGLILLSSPFVVAAAVAGRTKHVKIGLAVHMPRLELPEWAEGAPLSDLAPSDLSLQEQSSASRFAAAQIPPADPILTAEDAATVDQISGGRFMYGVGARSGGNEARREMLFEFLEVMKQAWREPKFTGFDGRYFNYPSMLGVAPQPYQQPGPPIMMAVESTTSFPALGEKGYPILIGAGTAHNDFGHSRMLEDVNAYREAWKVAGHPGEPDVVVRIPTHVRPTREQAEREMRPCMERAAERLSRKGIEILSQADPGAASVERAERANLFGTPEEAIDRIHEIREEFGASCVMLETNYYGALDRDAVLESMRLITDKVIPAFK